MFVCIVCVYVYINIYIYKYALRSTAWQLTKFRAQEETKKIINKLITIGEKETPFALKNSSVFSVVVVAVVVVLLLLSRTENSCILTTTKSVGVTSLLLSCTLIEMRKRRKQTKEKKLNLSLNFKIFGLTYLYIIIK